MAFPDETMTPRSERPYAGATIIKQFEFYDIWKRPGDEEFIYIKEATVRRGYAIWRLRDLAEAS